MGGGSPYFSALPTLGPPASALLVQGLSRWALLQTRGTLLSLPHWVLSAEVC